MIVWQKQCIKSKNEQSLKKTKRSYLKYSCLEKLDGMATSLGKNKIGRTVIDKSQATNKPKPFSSQQTASQETHCLSWGNTIF